MKQEQIDKLNVGQTIWVYTDFSGGYEKRVINSIHLDSKVRYEDDEYHTLSSKITKIYFEGREYGVTAEELLQDKWIIRYNHKESESYKKKEKLRNIKRKLGISQLQGKNVIVHNILDRNNSFVDYVFGKVTNTFIKKVTNAKEMNGLTLVKVGDSFYRCDVQFKEHCFTNRRSLGTESIGTYTWTKYSTSEHYPFTKITIKSTFNDINRISNFAFDIITNVINNK